MPIDIDESHLPGVGPKHVLRLETGRHVGVISHRDGRRELVVYDRDDPDATRDAVVLTTEEADVLAELLGAPRIIERIASLHDQVAGLVTESVTVPEGSACAARTLGETLVRTRSGASVVAVGRAGRMHLSPGAEFRLLAGDTVVVIGTEAAAATAIELLTGR